MPELPIFYTPDLHLPDYTLPEEESQHAAKVLRLREGGRIQLNDGRGNGYVAEITIAHPRHCQVKVIDPVEQILKHSYHLHIAMAPTKNIDRFEWFLEKATEIGIDEITPLMCDHSERKAIHPDRLERILVAAMKQSQKLWMPVLHPMTLCDDFLNRSFPGIKGMAYCGPEEKKTLPLIFQKGQPITLLIGPEGDFSEKEITKALSLGFHPITLGKSRLRTETAGLAACHSVFMLSEMLS